MKKICVVLHSLQQGGGIQERRALLVKAWAQHGYSVLVIAPHGGDKDIQAFSRYAQIEHLGLSLKRQRFLIFLLGLKLYLFFRKRNDYDVILASGILTNFTVVLAAKAAKIKSDIFCTYHNPIKKEANSLTWLSFKISSCLVKYTARRSRQLGANSVSLARELESIYRNVSVKTIYNPVISQENNNTKALDRTPDNTKSLDRAPGGTKKVLAVGRLTKQKGFDILIQAFSNLGTDITLDVAGDGPQKERLVKLCKKLQLDNRVRFIGFQKDVISLMKSADCFVLSSRWEGFGNVLVEALYAQVPIVSFDCDYGPREVLENGRYGVLVKEQTPESLALAIEKTLQSKNAYNSRWEDFTVQKIALEYLEFMGVSTA